MIHRRLTPLPPLRLEPRYTPLQRGMGQPEPVAMEATETAEAECHKQTPRPAEAGEDSPPLGGGKEPRSPHLLGVDNLEHMEDRAAM